MYDDYSFLYACSLCIDTEAKDWTGLFFKRSSFYIVKVNYVLYVLCCAGAIIVHHYAAYPTLH